MPKRLLPCPYRVDELELRDGTCHACGKPVVDLAAGTEEEARAWFSTRSGGCVRMVRSSGGGLRFRQPALTGALSVAAALAMATAPRLDAALPEVSRGAPIELPDVPPPTETPPPRLTPLPQEPVMPYRLPHLPIDPDEQLDVLGYVVYEE